MKAYAVYPLVPDKGLCLVVEEGVIEGMKTWLSDVLRSHANAHLEMILEVAVPSEAAALLPLSLLPDGVQEEIALLGVGRYHTWPSRLRDLSAETRLKLPLRLSPSGLTYGEPMFEVLVWKGEDLLVLQTTPLE